MNKNLATALERYRGDDRIAQNRVIAKFCGVSNYTAAQWGVKRDPVGAMLNKLWYFLADNGHEIKELKELNEVVCYVGRLLAYSVITEARALELVGLGSESRPSYIWDVLQGKIMPNAIRKGKVKLDDLMTTYEEQLATARRQAAEQGLVQIRMRGRPIRPLSPPPTGDPPPESSEAYVVLAASFISALRPLVKQIVSEGEESIKALRVAVEDDTFYAVLDGLKAMSSRRAHQFYQGDREQ